MAGRGRARLSRSVYSFEAGTLVVPDEITLDTSFVAHALDPGETHHEGAQGFLDRLSDSGTTLVFNRLLEFELREAAFRAPLKERYPRDWRRRRHDGRSLRRARRLIAETMAAWNELLEAFDYLRIEPHEVAESFGDFMDLYGLSSYDAVHAATAEFAGVPRLLTTDAGFATVPEGSLEIWIDSTRVGVCRRRRSGVG